MGRLASLATAALLAAACASLPTDVVREPSRAATDTGATTLGRVATRFAGRGGESSGVRLLGRGLDAFVARLALAELAERTLDVQYYIWHPDTTGRLLTHALLRAADRGVRVRVLLDDIGTAPDDANLLALDAHPNVEVRLFNPLARRHARNLAMLGSFERTNRRMHNKSFTADNQAAIVGGRNVGDEYYEAAEDVDFNDLDLLAVGPVVREVSASFDAFWNSAASYPIAALAGGAPDAAKVGAVRESLAAYADSQRDGRYARSLRESDLLRQLRSGDVGFTPATVRVLADDPAKVAAPESEAGHLLPQMLPEFSGLQRELLLVSPYFVPGEAGVAALTRLRDRGLRVRIVTNALEATDVAAVHAGYARYREPLLAAGVEIFEMKASARREGTRRDGESKSGLSGSSRASLHAKTIFFDCRRFFVGSMNVDPRSVFTNTEIGVMVDAPALAGDACARLEERLPALAYRVERSADGTLAWRDGEARLDREPSGGAWRRFQAWFFSLLPIEPLL